MSGADLVPLAGALALAALAGLAAVIATRGALRRAAGVLLALFGAGAGAAIMTSVTAATVINVAASKVASPGSAAVSGAAGSTTSGSTGGGALVVSGSTAQAFMTGTPWHVAVLIGALLVFIAGLATALRGPDWPVMSARYDAPGPRDAARPGGRAGRAGRTGRAGRGGTTARRGDDVGVAERRRGPDRGRPARTTRRKTHRRPRAPRADQGKAARPARRTAGSPAGERPPGGAVPHVNVRPMHSEGKLPGGRREPAREAASIGGATFPI